MVDAADARRGFLKSLASVAAAGVVPLDAQAGVQAYPPARLHLAGRFDGLRPADLEVGETYLFHYPYVTTPCFLINTGDPVAAGEPLVSRTGLRYRAPAGVGPDRSIVAFSAICAHRMSHPARQVSFITYRHGRARFWDRGRDLRERARLIYCCSEKSVYDALDGARVLAGPAPQPLACIALEAREDGLTALGTLGPEMFETYFERFSERLTLEYRISDPRRPAGAEVPVMRLTQWSARQVLCGATTPNTTVMNQDA